MTTPSCVPPCSQAIAAPGRGAGGRGRHRRGCLRAGAGHPTGHPAAGHRPARHERPPDARGAGAAAAGHQDRHAHGLGFGARHARGARPWRSRLPDQGPQPGGPAARPARRAHAASWPCRAASRRAPCATSSRRRARAGSATVALIEGLSPRENDVLRMLADGLTDREIATALIISPRTVETHVSNILHKLDVRKRAEAAQRYRETVVALAAAMERHEVGIVVPQGWFMEYRGLGGRGLPGRGRWPWSPRRRSGWASSRSGCTTTSIPCPGHRTRSSSSPSRRCPRWRR